MNNNLSEKLIVVVNEKYKEESKALAEKIGVDTDLVVSEDKLSLQYTEEGLVLTDGQLSIRGDLSNMIKRVKQSNLERELLVRVSKIKNQSGGLIAVDATAGMGEDSILLAAAGFYVHLYEYDPVIAALLEDALKRAAFIPELSHIVAHMELHQEDSIEALNNMPIKPDVVLLDPMFPTRQKSALVKKKFQLLQRLEQPCSDENELLEAAKKVHPKKIVIKRPAKGPFLAGMKPSHSLEGKAIRYDCIVLN